MSLVKYDNKLSDGILLINKPLGMRSTFCVNLVKKVLGKNFKVGHGGTLDSTASGLLIVMVGKGTRLSNYVMNLSKTYRGSVQLGIKTSTDDSSGDVQETSDLRLASPDELETVFKGFIGKILEKPPQISAIKVDGKRAHKVAREEGTVKLKTRPVFINSISLDHFIEADQTFDFTVNCHKGTYIRSLARDIGDKLGTLGHLCALSRTRIGSYHLSNALTIDPENLPSRSVLLESLVPLSSICSEYASYTLDKEDEGKILNGISVPLTRAKSLNKGVVLSSRGVMIKGNGFISICSLRSDGKTLLLHPDSNLVYSQS